MISRFRKRDRPQYANYENENGDLYIDKKVDSINQKKSYPYFNSDKIIKNRAIGFMQS